MADPRLLGTPATILFEGRPYPVQHPRDFEVEAAFVELLELRAALAIERHRAKMGPAWYVMQCQGWRRDCGGQELAWGSAAWAGAFYSAWGVEELLVLQMEKARPPEAELDCRAVARRLLKDEAKKAEAEALIWETGAGGSPTSRPQGPTPAAPEAPPS
jgi:hypothetical protein